MARTNVAAVNNERTFEGAHARTPKAVSQLERQVATCMLFEGTYYETGVEIAQEIARSCEKVKPEEIAAMAIKAREDFKLRHVPLFLLVQLNKRRKEAPESLLRNTVARVVQRPDEMGELLSLIMAHDPSNKGKTLKKSIGAQVKKGLAAAFHKFSPYQLAKWNKDSTIKLRDVLFLTHAKPQGPVQAETWKALIEGTLETADTWEAALSAGKDKRETWERLLSEGKLGYMALLMNLRNMEEAQVTPALVEKALLHGAAGSRALPFRFISAFKHAPSFAQALSDAMIQAISTEQKLLGSTALLIDVSGSMDAPISDKSTMLRWEAAAALGILLREICESVRVYTFSDRLIEVPNVRGIGMLAGVQKSQPHNGTYLGESLRTLSAKATPDRVIVITDEQSHDDVMIPDPCKGYIVNVAAYRPALDISGQWTRVNGFSERLVDWIRYEESNS